MKDATETVIERGSIVSLSEQPDKCKRYMVMCVYDKNGSKWHLSAKGDNPAWPLQPSDQKKYRVLSGKKVDAEVISVKLLGELHFRIEY